METMNTIMDYEFEACTFQDTHFHQNPEIIYILEGEAKVTMESEHYEMKKGDILLINANKRHSIKADKEDLLFADFYINFSMLTGILGTNQILLWCNTMVDKNESYDQLRNVLNRILNRYYEREKEGALYLNSIYYEAVYLLTSYFIVKADDSRLKDNDTPDSSRIFEIQNYVQENYQKQLSLNDLAKQLYLSNAYLSKYIKKRFGLSFLEYVNNIRLFHALDELIYSEKKITRIAMDNGFPTTAAFNKVFKDVYHVTPSVYRSTLSAKQSGKELSDLGAGAQKIAAGTGAGTGGLATGGSGTGDSGTAASGSKDRIEQRIKEYLAGEVLPEDDIATKNMDVYEVDANETTRLEKSWSKIINIGSIDELLNHDMQQQILTMKREIGFPFVRIWNIFVQDMYDEAENGQWHYNFSRIDRGLDFLVENGLKAYIELSFKPIHVSYTINSTLAKRDNDIIFHDRDSYQKVMQDFSAHLVNRYGVDEVESWYFELWKDERMNMLDENGWYFDCFEIGYEALKAISTKIKVGGAGFAMGYDRYQYRELIQNWKTRKIRPDFISVYSYSYFLIQQNNMYFGKRSLDHSFIKNQLEIFKEILREEDFLMEELHITEWNFTISNRNCINDSCAQGAYVMKSCIESVGQVDMMGYWHGSDLHSEYYDSEAVLCGDNGLLTRDGIKKPSFYAFHFMHFLQPYLLGKTENALLSSDRRGSYTIVCHNCKQFSYRYTMKDEKNIQIEDIDEIYADMDAIHLKFKINHVANGDYVMRMFYIDKDNGSIQNVWKDMDYIKNLSKGEIEYMRRCATPKVEMRRLRVEDGVLRIETKLLAHEIKALDIHYQY